MTMESTTTSTPSEVTEPTTVPPGDGGTIDTTVVPSPLANEDTTAAAAAAATTATTTAEEQQDEEEEELLLKHLVIVPPPACAALKPIAVPPLRPDEPVASIRAALAELVGYAHITNYQLTYNGSVLDDYGDLTILQQQQDQGEEQAPNNTAGHIQMELKPYQTVREHVLRLQHLLDGNPPVVKALVEPDPTTAAAESPTKTGTTGKTKASAGTKTQPEPQSTTVPPTPTSDDSPTSTAAGSKKNKKKEPKVSTDNGKTVADTGISSSPINLEHFFDAATGEKLDETLLHQLNELDHRMMLSRVVTLTFLAPPSPRRKLFGDLAYIRIHITPTAGSGAGELEEDIYVTAIPSGFHRNKSTATNFDPTPLLEAPCHAHELLDCLLQASPTFTRLWNTTLETAQERLRLTLTDSPLQALHRAAAAAAVAANTVPVSQDSLIRAFDSAIFRPSWLVPHTVTTTTSTPTSRTAAALATRDEHGPSSATTTTTLMRPHEPIPLEQDYPTFGLDLTTGVARDWNEELQSAREMPATTIQERLERAR